MTAPPSPTSARQPVPALRDPPQRRDKGATGDKPKWVTYAVLGAVILISVLPLYYTFLLASNTSAEVAQNPIPPSSQVENSSTTSLGSSSPTST